MEFLIFFDDSFTPDKLSARNLCFLSNLMQKSPKHSISYQSLWSCARNIDQKKKKFLRKKFKKKFFWQKFSKIFFVSKCGKNAKKTIFSKKNSPRKKKIFFFHFFQNLKFFQIFFDFFFGFIFKNRVLRNNSGNFHKIKIIRNARLDVCARFCEGFIEKYWKLKKLEGPTLKIEKSEKSQKETGKSIHIGDPKIVEDLTTVQTTT